MNDMEIDWRSLLVKYMSIVGSAEGVSYLSQWMIEQRGDFMNSELPISQEDLEHLKIIEKELDDMWNHGN